MFDNVPPRSHLTKTPGNRCLFCGDRVIVSPTGKNWLWAEWGGATRLVHAICPEKPDKAIAQT